MSRRRRRQVILVAGVLVLLTAIVLGFVLAARMQLDQPGKNTGQQEQLLDPLVLQEVTNISPLTWKTIGTGNVANPVHPIQGSSLLRGPHGLPELFYLSGEFCPNCAAERWGILIALNRFGTFTHLRQIQSSEGQISTISFYGSNYTSQYLDFVPVETRGNVTDNSGQYALLQTPTASQQQLVSAYDPNGNIPFLDIGNRYYFLGASYDYSVLENGGGNPLTWQEIGSSLNNPASPIAQNILGAAHYLTTTICLITDQQPANACHW